MGKQGSVAEATLTEAMPTTLTLAEATGEGTTATAAASTTTRLPLPWPRRRGRKVLLLLLLLLLLLRPYLGRGDAGESAPTKLQVDEQREDEQRRGEQRLQPYVAEAATVRGGGCNPRWRRLQPYAAAAATLGGRRLQHEAHDADVGRGLLRRAPAERALPVSK